MAFTVTRIYGKPLLPNRRYLSVVDMQKILKQSRRELVKRIQDRVNRYAFSPRAKKALRDYLSVDVGRSSISVRMSHPGYWTLIKGRRRRQMKWLVKANRPIPIVTHDGKLIFRNATPKSMADGKWRHPGIKPTTFVDEAKRETRKVIKDKLAKELRKQLQTAWARSK